MLCVCSCYLIRWWAMGLEPILTSVGSFRFTRLALVFIRQGNASLRICTHHENLNLSAISYITIPLILLQPPEAHYVLLVHTHQVLSLHHSLSIVHI